MMSKLIREFSEADAAEFWSHVDWSGGNEACWPWLSSFYANGYGDAGITGAHRIAFFLDRGQQPGKLLVCHTCDNKPCCNPAHLFLGTSKINAEDKVRKGRQARGETSGSSKLTEEKVRWAREAPGTLKELGAALGGA